MNSNNSNQNSLNKSLINNSGITSKITPIPKTAKKSVSNNRLVDPANKLVTPNSNIKPKSPQIFKKLTNVKAVNNSTIL